MEGINMNLETLRENRARFVAEARALHDAAVAENRDMTAAEVEQFENRMAEAETIKTRIARLEGLEASERELEGTRGRIVPATRTFNSDPHAEIRSWMLGTVGGRDFTFTLGSEGMRRGEDVRSWSNRNQSTQTGAAGGYTIAPEFHAELEKALLSFGGKREDARELRTTTGAELPWATLDDTGNEGGLLAELAEAQKQDMAFSQIKFGAYKFTSGIVMVSEELLQDTAYNLAGEIGTALGERIARPANRLFTVGTGVNQPQGVVTGATQGIVGSSATAITYDDLVDLEHSVDAAYRRRGAKFMFADSTLRELKKLKDTEGRPIWNAGLTGNAPATILGYEYIINDDVQPLGANNKSVLFGDFSKFIIRDVRDVTLRRLNERYAEVGAVAFLAFSRHDSRLVDAGTHPIKYLRNAAA
jgi:HK97 family phage major capsid protein